MTISLRAATPHDLEAIARIWYHGWFDGHLGHVPDALLPYRRLADFRARVPGRIEATTVATEDARVVGFLTVHADEIEQVYVAESARGGGAAGALLEHGERRIAARFDAAWLAVVAGNTRACRFYTRNGWRDAGGIEYPAEAGRGHIPVAARRYEKRLPRSPAI
ncbi:MAG TPA: GNAT family N-acetyltransferase [Vicinamibacteria bacterium]|nr:GNAT family N-acetyltransferase [Vicinamibacteria bacterium]